MAKRKIHLSMGNVLLAPSGLVVDAFTAGTLLKSTASGYATSDLADSSTAQEALLAPEVVASEGADITTAHTIGGTVEPIIMRSGEFANALVASGQNITSKGVALASNGAGALKIAAVDGTDVVLFVSDEIVNTGASAALVQVRKP